MYCSMYYALKSYAQVCACVALFVCVYVCVCVRVCVCVCVEVNSSIVVERELLNFDVWTSMYVLLCTYYVHT